MMATMIVARLVAVSGAQVFRSATRVALHIQYIILFYKIQHRLASFFEL
jgi:hypothetical protein